MDRGEREKTEGEVRTRGKRKMAKTEDIDSKLR